MRDSDSPPSPSCSKWMIVAVLDKKQLVLLRSLIASCIRTVPPMLGEREFSWEGTIERLLRKRICSRSWIKSSRIHARLCVEGRAGASEGRVDILGVAVNKVLLVVN